MNTKKIQRYSLFILLCGLAGAVLPTNVAAQYVGAGTYFIVARHSGKALTVNLSSSNGALIQSDYHSGDDQKFAIGPTGSGNQFVSIKVLHSGKCLDVPAFSRRVVGLQQWDCNGGDNQQFVLEQFGCFYKIMVSHSRFYFDIQGGSRDNGAPVNQYPIPFRSNPGENQLFQFIKIG